MQPSNPSALNTSSTDFNWPTVIFLLIITGIPAIPGLFILLSLTVGSENAGVFSAVVNPLYFIQPLPIIIHAGSGLFFFFNMPFQFSGALRVKKPQFHKASGYVTVVSGSVMGISGIWVHYFLNEGVIDLRYVSLSIQGISLFVAFFVAVNYIIKRNIPLHRKWMSRAIAISLSLLTLAFIEVIFMLILGEQAQDHKVLIRFFNDFGNLIGMVFNLLVVEYFVKR